MAKFITELFGFCGFKHRVLVACFWAEFIWFVLERVDLLPESCDLIIGKLQGLLKSSRFKRGIIGYPYGNYHYTTKDTPTDDVTHVVPIMPNVKVRGCALAQSQRSAAERT